jgi:hypothetical protein
MLITVFGPPTIMPSPLQLRFAVRFTTPLTTCPHAAFDDDASVCEAAACCSESELKDDVSAPVVVLPCCSCCAAADITPIVTLLNVNKVSNASPLPAMDRILRFLSSSIPKSKYL